MILKKSVVAIFFLWTNFLLAQKNITIKNEDISCIISINLEDSIATIQLQNLTTDKYIYMLDTTLFNIYIKRWQTNGQNCVENAFAHGIYNEMKGNIGWALGKLRMVSLEPNKKFTIYRKINPSAIEYSFYLDYNIKSKKNILEMDAIKYRKDVRKLEYTIVK